MSGGGSLKFKIKAYLGVSQVGGVQDQRRQQSKYEQTSSNFIRFCRPAWDRSRQARPCDRTKTQQLQQKPKQDTDQQEVPVTDQRHCNCDQDSVNYLTIVQWICLILIKSKLRYNCSHFFP